MTKSFTFRLVGLTALAASALAISAPAFAQGNDDQSNSVRVSYSDLDTSRPAGQAELKSRVEAAAIEACGGQVDIRDLDRRALVNQCRTQAVSTAMAQLGSSQYAQADTPTSGR
jgi:UrcA family protein